MRKLLPVSQSKWNQSNAQSYLRAQSQHSKVIRASTKGGSVIGRLKIGRKSTSTKIHFVENCFFFGKPNQSRLISKLFCAKYFVFLLRKEQKKVRYRRKLQSFENCKIFVSKFAERFDLLFLERKNARPKNF